MSIYQKIKYHISEENDPHRQCPEKLKALIRFRIDLRDNLSPRINIT
jgi:hypothetical protein